MVEVPVRSSLSALLSSIFVSLCVAFMSLWGAHKLFSSTEALQESAQKAGLRAALVDAASHKVAEEIAKDPNLVPMNASEVRGMVEGVITQEWLNSNIVLVHESLLAIAQSAQLGAEIDLREFKSRLESGIRDLRKRAEENCTSVFGSAECENAHEAARMARRFENEGKKHIGRIADRIDLMEGLSPDGREEAQTWLSRLDTLRSYRILGALSLLTLFLVICALNFPTFADLFGRLGTLSLATAIAYLALGASIRWIIGTSLERSDGARFADFARGMSFDMLLSLWPSAAAMSVFGIACFVLSRQFAARAAQSRPRV